MQVGQAAPTQSFVAILNPAALVTTGAGPGCASPDSPQNKYSTDRRTSTRSDREVDLLIDLGRGRVVGVEVKAGSVPSRADARHLIRLRDTLGDSFVRGVVLHTGPHPFELDDRVWALPIWARWADTTAARPPDL